MPIAACVVGGVSFTGGIGKNLRSCSRRFNLHRLDLFPYHSGHRYQPAVHLLRNHYSGRRNLGLLKVCTEKIIFTKATLIKKRSCPNQQLLFFVHSFFVLKIGSATAAASLAISSSSLVLITSTLILDEPSEILKASPLLPVLPPHQW